MTSHTLEIDSVQKSYDHRMILTDVYLKVQTGNIVGILGRNGCGKSTLLKIIFGILKTENKFIRIDNNKQENPFKQGDIAYLPQNYFVPKNLKVYKVVELYIPKEDQLDFLNDPLITHIKKQKFDCLSGGERRYLEIKLVLNTSAKFVLLDEPYNGLAPMNIIQINKLIIDSAYHKGIVLTDHDYKNILNVSNRLCLINNGALHEIKDKKELIRFGYLTEEMLKSI